MDVIPAIDVRAGRSRVVYWPGASTGSGAPTDRADRIAERFVAAGARLIHLVDFDGARSGTPANLEALGAVASRIAVPLQIAGGVDTADGIRLAFAAGVRRLVLSHGGTAPDAAFVAALASRHDVDVLVAGGATDLDAVRRLRDAGVTGLILGEALLSGAIDFPRALEAAA